MGTPKGLAALALGCKLCAKLFFSPVQPRTIEQRLQDFERFSLRTKHRVVVRWSRQQIPFIAASSDEDLAYTIGAVQAHLRLSQLEFMRRISQGRLAEILGTAAVPIDLTLRTLDLNRGVPESMAMIPEQTHDWLSAFVQGLNGVATTTEVTPKEFEIFNIPREPWTESDVIRICKLAAMDFSWKVWRRLHHLREHPEWTSIWERLVEATMEPVPSVAGEGTGQSDYLRHFFHPTGPQGSNALAIASWRSSSDSALLSCDPHLTIMVPNNWLCASIQSPSYQATGLMIPGLPMITVGRNKRVAWAGTNLHAASSDLIDVSSEHQEDFTARNEKIQVGSSKSETHKVRDSQFGPIISDAPIFESARDTPLALKWIGHSPSDEISAFLSIMKSASFSEFLNAADGISAPALNLVYADNTGKVGACMAAHLPKRSHKAPKDLVSSPDDYDSWDTIITTKDLPVEEDPEDGFVVSANNRPLRETCAPVGYFFSPDERVRRLRELLSVDRPISTADLQAMHRDVTMPSAEEMRDFILAYVERVEMELDEVHKEFLTVLRTWDGVHGLDSEGALAFESLLFALLREFHGADRLDVYLASQQPWNLLRKDLKNEEPRGLSAVLKPAIDRASRVTRKYRTWGAVHQLEVSHPLSILPIVGKQFVRYRQGVGGGNETLMKTAHGLSDDVHTVSFGANARFIADLSDCDESFVVLLGGQDGWLGSTNFDDQISEWNSGKYFKLPLRLETAADTFPYKSAISPNTPSSDSRSMETSYA